MSIGTGRNASLDEIEQVYYQAKADLETKISQAIDLSHEMNVVVAKHFGWSYERILGL
jgi:hypothetical protein